MEQTHVGRPTKGARIVSRMNISEVNAHSLNRLCAYHRRSKTEIVSALIMVGLDHGEDIAAAIVSWPSSAGQLPPRYSTVDAEPAAGDLPRFGIALPLLHHRTIEAFVAMYTQAVRPSTIRSGLVWLGLRHVDELDAMLAELDDVQRLLPGGRTVGDYYADTIAEYTGDNPPAPAVALRAVRRVRAGAALPMLAHETGLDLSLLAALSAEAISTIDGRLPLTG